MLQIAHMTAPMAGFARNGDAVYVRVDRLERVAMVAVIDALGHGPNAADEAERVLALLDKESTEHSPAEILRRLHRQRQGGRGAAVTLLILKDKALSACGVGNVALRSRGTNVPFVLSPGILGSRVSNFRLTTVNLKRGDRIVLYSDGMGSHFSLDAVAHLNAEAACKSLFGAHRKPSDDATILVLDAED